jgi:membrane dipeptidase
VGLAPAFAGDTREERLAARALELHHRILSVDTHCDTPLLLDRKGLDVGVRHPGGTLLGGDVDLVRMKEGGLAASFFAVFVAQGPRSADGYERAWAQALEALDSLDRMFAEHGGLCELALAPDNAVRSHRAGKRAIFLGLENAYPVGLDLERVQVLYRRGVRYITLCHSSDNDMCASATERAPDAPILLPRSQPDTGLTPLGARLVTRMNELGMMVDVSHISERSLADVLRITRAPVLASHSGARAVGDHPRNLSDDQLRAIARNGGVVQVPLVSEFLKPRHPDPAVGKAYLALWERVDAHFALKALGEDPAAEAAFEAEYQELQRQHPRVHASVSDLVDHIDHVVETIGVEHVGIGSDFDGGGALTDCRDVTALPAITAELMRRGYSERDIRRIWGENVMRVFRRVIEVAGDRRRQR